MWNTIESFITVAYIFFVLVAIAAVTMGHVFIK